MFEIVKVMPNILSVLFSRTRCSLKAIVHVSVVSRRTHNGLQDKLHYCRRVGIFHRPENLFASLIRCQSVAVDVS